ncbi:hypothetical protein EMIHUDRAFT_117255 [Emiliania huxleyi CCMP1516]|uniref:VOC domain-containing protein n=2 Tax=Emiliania huxleyi TaxID=2903 RepID=A0A0D3JCT2_EMIH1|nr:hypothetical protein EMIHUDRAFT_117255 [Emiliania huxleyi CCMP1516]EOD21317.1 hypothetical protein EMIHUDRAFT_117255 [Emiliania huxleyi CCMP1516]|eukprot:XP_005773746.1 hypothetical protein EMIHUDRAFT_117255 [Emiliania huxleyi CCMP1516]
MQMHLATRDLGVAFRSGEAINPIGVGPRYIAFRTDDIDAFKRHLDAHGVQYADYGSRLAPDLFSRSAGEGVVIEVHAVLREGARRPLCLTMSSSGASAIAAAKQRHQEQLRADTSALVDAARGQRQMPELPPYVPEFDLAFMSQMLGGGAVRSEPEDPATGDDETMMQEA